MTTKLNNQKFQMIIPTAAKDYGRLKRNLNRFFEYMPIYELIFIGPESIKVAVEADAAAQKLAGKVKFLDENDVLPMSRVAEVIIKRVASEGYTMSADSKPGWYYQQFLKMSYSSICPDEYYISWDADTIPLHKIEIADENDIPYFNMKTECRDSYFRTLRSLFGFEKSVEQSFISENMLFNTALMEEMKSDIMKSPLRGDTYYEKIFYAIDINDMKRGFSEFETYGTWMLKKHPDQYRMRTWDSLRLGGAFFKPLELNEEDCRWLSQDFDAITFESYNPLLPDLYEIFHNQEFRAGMTPKMMLQIIEEEGYFTNNPMLTNVEF